MTGATHMTKLLLPKIKLYRPVERRSDSKSPGKGAALIINGQSNVGERVCQHAHVCRRLLFLRRLQRSE
jgi:hypothetical protein